MLPIILAIRDEEDRSFAEQIYIKYGRKIAFFAGKYLDNEPDVEDCIQDVFVVLIDHLEEFRHWTEEHQKNFLVKCCRCIAINKYKSNMKRYSKEMSMDGEAGFELADGSENITELIISEENKRRICEIIENMDSKYGDILYLRGFLGMKNTEIAKMLNISAELVNVRYQRAKAIILSTKGEEINEIRGR